MKRAIDMSLFGYGEEPLHCIECYSEDVRFSIEFINSFTGEAIAQLDCNNCNNTLTKEINFARDMKKFFDNNYL